MKRGVCGLLTALFFCGAVGATEVPAVSAKSVVLMDADSGRVLYGQNVDEPRLIASITKLMTALVALESGHALDEVVTVRPEWTGIEGSSLYLKPGEEIRLETLLYGLLLRSGNDAAHAVAGFCADDISGFVNRMNEMAVRLGMQNTHFENPSGLDGAEHFSSAYDMALLARACLKNETLSKIVATKSITLENRIFTNHNKLLWQYDGCIGLKTGYTKQSGRTLVSAAERDGMTLICVTLNAPDDWRDHEALYDYGFARYERHCLIQKGDLLCTLPVEGSLVPLIGLRAESDLYAALTSDEKPVRKLERLQRVIQAPIVSGEMLGELRFLLGKESVGQLSVRFTRNISYDIAPEPTGIARFFGR